MKEVRRLSPIMLGALVMLTACGGGGGGGGGGFPMLPAAPPPSAAGPAPAPAPSDPGPGPTDPETNPPERPMVTTPYSFKLGSANALDFKALLAELQSPEMAGRLSDLTIPIRATPSPEGRAIYRGQENAPAYLHRGVSAQDATSLATLQSQGADGYRVIASSLAVDAGSFMTIFSKDTSKDIRYEYVDAGALPQTSAEAASFLESLNKFGQQGYCATSATITRNGNQVSITMLLGREKPTTARCSFEILPTTPTYAGFIAQGNEKGANGGKFSAALGIDGTPKVLFVRDDAQKSTFKYYATEYTSTAEPGSIEQASDFVKILNREGALGSRPFQQYQENNRYYMIFTTSYDCKGLLC
ncbi:hypothetical protein [Variovorax sp.]|uniref:hypothetical protein n=1 Tax=Variovorax sp. TaxID=1871043 RepID=UPI0037DA013A